MIYDYKIFSIAMASLIDAITLLFGACALLFCGADAYYCEWSFCEPDLYCCGNNQCCSKVYSPWYFWSCGCCPTSLVLWWHAEDIESANLQLEEKHGTP
ncbi:hypothetical protein B566_EDAN002744 [Ephemera danica]|nr:hypothetical protein B566_EDAN002744 [Ephemera danica]